MVEAGGKLMSDDIAQDPVYVQYERLLEENVRLREASMLLLRRCRDARNAIASIPPGILGQNTQDGYWFRDELLAYLDAAIDKGEALA